jgi:hypothetical protein
VRASESGGQIPLFEYLKIFVNNTNVAIWIFLCVHLARQWRTRRERDLLDWTFTIFPFALLALLSCSHKTNDRYFLPATAMFCVLAGFGISDFTALLKSNRVNLFAAVALCFAAFFQTVQIPFVNSHSFSEYFAAFGHDDRAELVAWIRANLPGDAVIAQDGHADLPTPDRSERLQVQTPLPQKIIGRKMLADLGTLDELVQQNVTFAIVSESDYGKFFRKTWTSTDAGENAKKKFYDDLFVRGELLWERPRGTVIYLHPGLRVYRLPRRDAAPARPAHE